MEIDSEAYLEHFGIKGMRWGVRRDLDGVSRRTDKDAAKDAKEFARAKLFYGEGAGTRRKLIKAKVEARSSKDPSYARAFERHLAGQDLGTHAQRARGERSRADKKKSTKQGAGFIARRITGEWGTISAFGALAAMVGAAWMHTPQGTRALRQLSNKLDLDSRFG